MFHVIATSLRIRSGWRNMVVNLRVVNRCRNRSTVDMMILATLVLAVVTRLAVAVRTLGLGVVNVRIAFSPDVIAVTGQRTRVTWLNTARTSATVRIAVVPAAVAIVVVPTVSTTIVGTVLIVTQCAKRVIRCA